MSIAVQAANTSAAASDAAASLYERHSRRLFAFCLRRLRSREEAEDAVQQTFLNAFGAMRGGFRPSVERAWLYRIAENVCADRLRASSRRCRHEAADVDALREILPAREPEKIPGLRRALAELPASQQRALLLREWQGMSYREIAAELSLSESAVETLLFRARRSLARRLDDRRQALRSWVGEGATLLGWLKSAFAGGSAVKAGVAVVVTAGVGAATVTPIVGGGAPTPPVIVKHQPTRAAGATVPADAAAPARHLPVRRPAPGRRAAAATATSAPGVDLPAAGGRTRAGESAAPPAPAAGTGVPLTDTSRPRVDEAPQLPVGPAEPKVDAPPLLQTPAPTLDVPDLPAPTVEAPAVDVPSVEVPAVEIPTVEVPAAPLETVRAVTDALPELPTP